MQEKLINFWYEKRMSSSEISEEQKKRITQLKESAVRNGWTAYAYEVAVRNLLGLVKPQIFVE